MIRKASLPSITFAAIALIFCSVARAQQTSSPEDKAEETTGSIKGRVVNENGQPLAQAGVYVRAFGANGQSRTTTSGADGTFQVSGLDPLAYIVGAALPAYTTLPRDPDNQGTYFRVGDSVRIELVKGAVITGTVTSATGEPVVSVPVRVSMIRDGNNQPLRYETPFFKERPTDDRGIYRIYGLAAGTYIVSAGGSGLSSNSNLNAYDGDVPTYAPASTRDTAAEITLRPGEESSNIDIRYRGEPGHIVSGRVSGGAGPQGYTIRMNTIAGGRSQLVNSLFQSPESKGFSISGVGDGDYDLTAVFAGPGGDAAVSEFQRIKVSGADVTGIELTTRPLGSITGKVVLEESKAAECKAKRRPSFAETVITPWHNEKILPKDQPQFLWSIGAPALPDKQGDFTIRNLAPGQYRFNTRSPVKYWYLQSITLQPSGAPAAKAAVANRPVDAARNWTTVKPGERLSGLIITLAAGAASLRGQIKLAEGQAQPARMFTYLVPAEKEKAEDILRFFAFPVAADGSFALNNLPPGRYWIIAKPAADNEVNILSQLRLPEEAEPRAKLRGEAEAAKREIELKPCQNVADYQLPFEPR
jgi:hypothetical protein